MNKDDKDKITSPISAAVIILSTYKMHAYKLIIVVEQEKKKRMNGNHGQPTYTYTFQIDNLIAYIYNRTHIAI